jgi:hypothetical protein
MANLDHPTPNSINSIHTTAMTYILINTETEATITHNGEPAVFTRFEDAIFAAKVYRDLMNPAHGMGIVFGSAMVNA